MSSTLDQREQLLAIRKIAKAVVKLVGTGGKARQVFLDEVDQFGQVSAATKVAAFDEAAGLDPKTKLRRGSGGPDPFAVPFPVPGTRFRG